MSVPPTNYQQAPVVHHHETGVIASANRAAGSVEKASAAVGRELNKITGAFLGGFSGGANRNVPQQQQQQGQPGVQQPPQPPNVYHQAVLETRSEKSLGGLAGGNFTPRQFTLQGWTLSYYDGHKQQALDLRGCAITLAGFPNGFILTGPTIPKQRMEMRAKTPQTFQPWMDAFKLVVPIYAAPAH